ncbi:MAG: V-type ATPase subunit, partial [Firmicutes bacterium]|nr:V-type ATPase subunit [Bacillota bacterium]
YETMTQTMDGQMCDVIADRACLESMVNAAEASKHDILKEYTQQLAASADIRIALRASRTGKSINFLRAALIPCSSFDVGRMSIAAADSTEALMAFLENNGMAGAGEALKQSDHAFEKWCDDRIMQMVSPHRRTFEGVGPVVAYYFARKSEIKTVRMILTARANGLAEKDIRERIRKAYV